MSSIYEIKKDYQDILNDPEYIDLETGEITEEGELAFKNNQDNLENKCNNITGYIKNLESDSNGFKTEIDRINKLKKSNDNKIKSLKKLLDFALEGKPLNTDLFKFSFRKSESVSIFDKEKLKADFISEKIVEVISGIPEIKKFLKEEIDVRIQEAKDDGKEVNNEEIKKEVYKENGLSIEFKKNLQIK